MLCCQLSKQLYASQSSETMRIFQFPSNESEKQRWIAALPNIIQSPTKNMGVCELHWPSGAEMCRPHRSKYMVSRSLCNIISHMHKLVCIEAVDVKEYKNTFLYPMVDVFKAGIPYTLWLMYHLASF